jgi:uncharacterized membrane protein YfcA
MVVSLADASAIRVSMHDLHPVQPLFALSGFIVGLLVGQTGMGGGSLMTPILVLLFGVHPAAAVGTDLLYASATKTVGTLVHGLNHTVNWQVVGRLAAGSVPATIFTLALISHFDMSGAGAGRAISSILGVMLLLTAVALIFRDRFLRVFGARLQNMPQRRTACLTIATGVMLGLLVTISSVGAGALGVTILLLLYSRLPMSVIVGSDIAQRRDDRGDGGGLRGKDGAGPGRDPRRTIDPANPGAWRPGGDDRLADR